MLTPENLCEIVDLYMKGIKWRICSDVSSTVHGSMIYIYTCARIWWRIYPQQSMLFVLTKHFPAKISASFTGQPAWPVVKYVTVLY